MKNVSSIIVGITSKKQFSLAVREAQKLAKLFDAKIYPVHVIEPLSINSLYPGSGDETVQRVADEIQGEIHRLYPTSSESPIEPPIIAVGDTAKEISRIAHKVRPSLIVMGRHSEGDFYSFRRSHADRLVKYAQNPVWIHPDHAITNLPKRILCPVDFTDNCLRAAQSAVSLAKMTQAQLDFIHVMPTPRNHSGFDGYISVHTELPQVNQDHYRRNTEIQFESLLTKLNLGDLNVATHIEYGEISDSVNTFSQENNNDLIVIGASSHSTIEKIFLGSTVRYILHDTKIDTLIIK